MWPTPTFAEWVTQAGQTGRERRRDAAAIKSVTIGNERIKLECVDIALHRLSRAHKLLLRVQRARRHRRFLASLARIATLGQQVAPDGRAKPA